MHNVRFTLETKLEPGAQSESQVAKMAAVAYSIVSKTKGSKGKFGLASFAPASSRFCGGTVNVNPKQNPFRKGTALQILSVAFKELTSSARCVYLILGRISSSTSPTSFMYTVRLSCLKMFRPSNKYILTDSLVLGQSRSLGLSESEQSNKVNEMHSALSLGTFRA
jgi:hypothetical protein